jgi:hypothetical protein
MEGYCSAGQNPQWAVVPMEEEEEEEQQQQQQQLNTFRRICKIAKSDY